MAQKAAKTALRTEQSWREKKTETKPRTAQKKTNLQPI